MAQPASRYLFGVLPLYSLLILTGILLAIFLATREERRLSLPKDTIVDLALWVIPLGILGARAYYVAFAWDRFQHDLLSVFRIWEGGLAIYGGIIGGFVAVCLFAKVRRLSLFQLTDILVPGLALAQAIGRWGNYFNMEAYGLEIVNPAWQFFPAGVLIPENGTNVWHMATFFYESTCNLLIFLFLYLLRTRMKKTGDTTLWYFLLYGCGRLLIEGLRLDSLMAGSQIRISQLLSVALSLGAVAVFLLRTLRHLPKTIWMIGGACAIAVSVLLLLPVQTFPFLGFRSSYGVLCALSVLAALPAFQKTTLFRKICLFLPLIGCTGGAFLLSGLSPALQCLLFSTCTILTGLTLYPFARNRRFP